MSVLSAIDWDRVWVDWFKLVDNVGNAEDEEIDGDAEEEEEEGDWRGGVPVDDFKELRDDDDVDILLLGGRESCEEEVFCASWGW